MPLTTAARDLLTSMLIGSASSTGWTSTSAQTVIGDSTQTFGSSQNDAGSSGANRVNASQDSGFPTSTAANVIAFRSTFSTSVGNFAWQEVVVKNTSASSTGTGQVLCRFVSTGLGTKTSAQSWQLTTTITVST